VLDFYRRVWQAFLAAFIGSAGIAAFLFKDYRVAFFIMLIIAIICLVVTLIGLYFDYRDARRGADRKALREAVRRLNPEYTEKQIDTWINGK
jgi:1,4-dihydroxy-2-naphthoate octaprenyltransferase